MFSCVRAQPDAAAAASFAAYLLQSPGRSTAASAVSNAPAAGAPRVGFLADVRRMNVGLTRGRRAVWVVCHADTLAASSAWRPLLQDARSRGVLLEARSPFNRLLAASDKQLRGSYWTPALPGAEGTPPAAACGHDRPAGGGCGPTAVIVKRRQPTSVGARIAAEVPATGDDGSGSTTKPRATGQAAATAGGATGADKSRSLPSSKQLLQQVSPPPPPSRPPAASLVAATGLSLGRAATSTKSAAGATGEKRQSSGSSARDDPSAGLQAAVHRRLQKQQGNDEQRGPPQNPNAAPSSNVGRFASKLSSQTAAKKASAATAAGAAAVAAGSRGGRKPAAEGNAADARRRPPPTTVGTARCGSIVGNSTPPSHKSQQQRNTAGAASSGAAPAGGISEKEKLKMALMQRIQQQKAQKQ